MITFDELKLICPQTRPDRLAALVDPLNDAMAEFSVNNVQRETAFIAQVAHESGQFRYFREIWGPTPAQERYEGRADLGNTQAGDGRKYLGRGPLQITGRANYAAMSIALGLDLLEHPELLEKPEHGFRAAGSWWRGHGCNELADAGEFRRLTRVINGGYNGLADRFALYERAQSVIG